MKEGIAQSKQRIKNWTKADWEKSGKTFNQICQDLIALMDRKLSTESPEVQGVVCRHYEWLKRFWTPTREAYAGHSEIIEGSELSKAYEVYHPELPKFMAAAVRIFAERELT